MDFELGNQRLLQLAEILDTADDLHRQRGEPTYDQFYFEHDCGTPSCAAGHWAAANPDRWSLPTMKLIDSSTDDISKDLCEEFCLSPEEFDELLEFDGCNGAESSKEAADYIRAFVARRQGS